MGTPERVYTADDKFHERRRRLAVAKPILDFESERLKRLQDSARDTRDP